MIENALFKVVGAIILILNKLRYSFMSYSSPRVFPITEYEKATEHDIRCVDNWVSLLSDYTQERITIQGKCVLELGPGADFGVGLYLLYKGAFSYSAIDVNDLFRSVPFEFYDRFFARLSAIDLPSKPTLDFVREQFRLASEGTSQQLKYVVRKDFDLRVLADKPLFDLVFSSASFEHFLDVEETVQRLSVVTKPGGIVIAVIDLYTHSRWIRDKDPLNIYRYSDTFYNLCRFHSSPNRVRPDQYRKIFEKNGWGEVKLKSLSKCDPVYLQRVRNSLSEKYRNDAFIDTLYISLCATKL